MLTDVPVCGTCRFFCSFFEFYEDDQEEDTKGFCKCKKNKIALTNKDFYACGHWERRETNGTSDSAERNNRILH